ncbi:MAG: hypothetical protein Q7S04_01490 [Candidatus Moranbacteria bacterium]|nr:hypothetical protein [Candidatus Moranbacteria bacterium]
MKKTKKEEMTVTYHYIEPKTPGEKAEQERGLDRAFDIIFEAVERKRSTHKGGKA